MTAFLPSFDTLYSSAKGNLQKLKWFQYKRYKAWPTIQLKTKSAKQIFVESVKNIKKEKNRLHPNEPIIAAYRNARLILDPAKAMANLQRMPADAKVSQVDKTRLESR